MSNTPAASEQKLISYLNLKLVLLGCPPAHARAALMATSGELVAEKQSVRRTSR